MTAALQIPEPRDDDSLRVLVVEDRPDEALMVANSFTPDAALIDIGLPGLDGLHVARELRKQDRKTLLVAITGRSEPKDILDSKAAGFDHHLPKPVDCGKLTAILASHRRLIHDSEIAISHSHGHP